MVDYHEQHDVNYWIKSLNNKKKFYKKIHKNILCYIILTWSQTKKQAGNKSNRMN